ncbi:MAG TPA: TolC family protein [Candidatus Coprenecus stercorigallinarum]|nr:TolC family protein [Candidatus Coprenecus stercorigallinarum]
MKIFYNTLPFLSAAAILLSASCGSLRAQSMESIDSVLAAVERNNLELRALQQNNEASRLEIQSQNNLQQDLSVSYSPFFSRGYDGVSSSELVVSMGFDFPSQYVSRGKSGKLQNQALDMQYALQRRDILLQAQLLCLDLVRLNQEKELLDTRMANADELLALMEKRFAEGGANVIEVNKVKMERMNVRTLAAQNEAARQNALQSLRAMNGNIPVELLAAEYPAVSDIVDYDEFYAEVMATDAGILSAEASVDAAAQEIKVNRQNWLPKFEVGYRRNTAMTEASHGFLVGASLPLFSSRNKTKIAEARHTAAQSELENARLQAETQLQSRYNELQQIRSAVQTYDVPLMHSTLDALKSAVLAGQMSVIDYYVEADNVYGNLSTYLSLENQYRKLLAEAYRNRL